MLKPIQNDSMMKIVEIKLPAYATSYNLLLFIDSFFKDYQLSILQKHLLVKTSEQVI